MLRMENETERGEFLRWRRQRLGREAPDSESELEIVDGWDDRDAESSFSSRILAKLDKVQKMVWQLMARDATHRGT